jgi:hypothetical protein
MGCKFITADSIVGQVFQGIARLEGVGRKAAPEIRGR